MVSLCKWAGGRGDASSEHEYITEDIQSHRSNAAAASHIPVRSHPSEVIEIFNLAF